MNTTSYSRTNLPTRVLITGGAGFIGSHLAEALLAKDYTVTIVDDLSTGRFENISHLITNPNFHFTIESITNAVVMDRLVSECSQIFHLAAAVGVKLIVDRPVHTIKTNIMGSDAVLEAALRYRVKVLMASTSEVYGKGNSIPFNEEDDVVLGPTSHNRWSYAASKMVDEFLALAYHHKRKLPVVIFRLFNTVGPRQTGRYGMVIPRFVQQAMNNEPLTVYGDGKQSRCFLHVNDAVKAIISLSENSGAIGQVFNVGSTEEVTMLELAHKVIKLSENKNKIKQIDDTKIEKVSTDNQQEKIQFIPYGEAYSSGFDDMRRRVPDISKIRELINWEPSYSLDEILTDIIDHHLTK